MEKAAARRRNGACCVADDMTMNAIGTAAVNSEKCRRIPSFSRALPETSERRRSPLELRR